MSLLQLQIDETLKKAISVKAKRYNVPASSLIKIILTDAFLPSEEEIGNIFNAFRDNNDKGISGKDFINMLES